MAFVTQIQKRIELGLHDEPFYVDDGCEAATACLSCQLSQCKYDDPAWFHLGQRMSRDIRRYYEMERDGLSVEAAALRFGVTVRTIYRLKERCLTQLAGMSTDDLKVFGTMATTRKTGPKGRGGGGRRRSTSSQAPSHLEVLAA